MRFSILIPVYNVEKYLDQCLRSVLTQDYSDFEVILVNDGSTDHSSTICMNYAKADARIKFYDKQNEGLLLTRRFSIKHAVGEYILFLDSDDFWEPGILSKLNREIANFQADMICYRFRRVTDEGKVIDDDIGVFPDRTFFDNDNKEDFITEFVSSPRLNNLWLKCVRASIVDKDADYRAFEDKKGEDILQSIALIKNANSILYIDDVFVNYRQSLSGRGRNFRIKYLDDYDVVKNHVYTNLINMNVSDSVMAAFYKRYIESLIGFLELIVSYSKDFKCFKETCDHMESFHLYKELCGKIPPNSIKRSCRNDYIKIKNHSYFSIYSYYKIKNQIKKLMPYHLAK